MEIGERYGKLVVLDIYKREKDKRKVALCKCDCGNVKEILISNMIKAKQPTRSCGCLRLEKIHKIKTMHGCAGGALVGKRNRLYRTWSNMKSRCYNPNVRSYKTYGARGIKVCNEWKDNFITFKNWALNTGYTDELVIDRIDPNKDYCPENCQWITPSENSVKRGDDKPPFCWGQNLITEEYAVISNIRSFAREKGLSYSAIDHVLHKQQKQHKNWIFGYL